MSANPTDSPPDRLEELWRELVVVLLTFIPSEHDPDHLSQLALNAAVRLAGAGGGWLETTADDHPLVRARKTLSEQNVQEIRGKLNLAQRDAAPVDGSVMKHAPVHLPFSWSGTQSLLILPLWSARATEESVLGRVVLLLPEATSPDPRRVPVLEHLASCVARFLDRLQQDLTQPPSRSGRMRIDERLAQRSHAGIFRATESGRILACNTAGARIMGFASPDDLTTVNSASFYSHPDERRALWRQLAAQGGSAMIDAVRIRKDGQPVRLLQDLQLFPDEPGGPLILHGIFFEVTREHPSAEEKQEALFRKMVEFHRDAIVLVDQEARILYCGPAVETIFGYRPEELLNRNGFDFVHPEDQVFARTQLRKLIAGTAVITAELRLLHHDGLWRWVELTAANHLDDPVLHGILLNYRDITERRQQEDAIYRKERRHQLIFEASGDAFWDWDVKTNSVHVSGSFNTLFGYLPAQIDTNASWWFTRIHPDDVTRIARVFREMTSAGQDFWSDEFRILQANESWGFVFSRGYILRGPDRDPLRMIGAMTDMTSYHRFQLLLEAGYGKIPIGFLAIYPNGDLIYANSAAHQLLQAQDHTLTGVNVFQDDRLRQLPFMAKIETALRERASLHLLESFPNQPERLQVDIYPTETGIVVFLQCEAHHPPSPTTGWMPHPLHIISSLPTRMGNLIKFRGHRRS